jgi:mRNA interferase MazF
MKLSRGDIVLIPFPYTDQSGAKVRPVVVINDSKYQSINNDLIVVFLTSILDNPHPEFDYALKDWKASRLLYPTLMKSKLAVIHASLVQHRVGSLSRGDIAGVERALEKALALSVPAPFA